MAFATPEARTAWLMVDKHWEKITFTTQAVPACALQIISSVGRKGCPFAEFLETTHLSVETKEDVHPFGEAGSPWPADARTKFLGYSRKPDQRTSITLRYGMETMEFALPKAGDVRVIVEYLESVGVRSVVTNHNGSVMAGTTSAGPSKALFPAATAAGTTTHAVVPPNKEVSEFWEKFAEVGASIAEAATGLPMGLGTAAKVVAVLFRGLQICAQAGKLIAECQEMVELFEATLQDLKAKREMHSGPAPKSFELWLRMAERALVEGMRLIQDLIGNGTQNASFFSLPSIREKIKQGVAKKQLEELIQTIDRCMARGILPVFTETQITPAPTIPTGPTPPVEEAPPPGSMLLVAPPPDSPELALWWRLHGILHSELLLEGLRVVEVTDGGDQATVSNYLTCMILFGILSPAEATFQTLQVCKTGQIFLFPNNLKGCFSSTPCIPIFASIKCCKDTTCRHEPCNCIITPCDKQAANIALQEPGAIWKILDMLQADSWSTLPITSCLMHQVGQACKLLTMAAQGVCPGIVAQFLWPKFRAAAPYAAIVPPLSPELIEADITDPAYRCAIAVRIFPRLQFASRSVDYALTNLASATAQHSVVTQLVSEPTPCTVAKLRLILQRPRPVDVSSFEALEHWIDESTAKHFGLSAPICDQAIYDLTDEDDFVDAISSVLADVCAMVVNKQLDWSLPLDDTTAWLLRCASFRVGRSLPPSTAPFGAADMLLAFYDAGCHSGLRVLFRSVTSAHKLNIYECQYGKGDERPSGKAHVPYTRTGAGLRVWMKHVLKEATATKTQAKAIATLQALCKDEQVVEMLAQCLQVETASTEGDKLHKDVPLLRSVLAIVKQSDSNLHRCLVDGAGSNVAFKLFLKTCFPNVDAAAHGHATTAADDSLHHLVYARTDGQLRVKTRPCKWAPEVMKLLFEPNSHEFIRAKSSHSPFGHRTVRKVDLTSHGLPISAWVKEYPDIAGLEFASWFMFSLLFRDYFPGCERKWGTPPVALLIQQKTGKTYLISLDMPGTPGTQFFTEPAAAEPAIPKMVEQLDVRMLQAVAVHALITSPSDATPQNMCINTAPDGSTRVAIIDNDFSFGSPFTSSIKAREQSGLASVSSWFEQQVPCQLGSAVLAFPQLYQHSMADDPFWHAWAFSVQQRVTWLTARWLDALRDLQSALLRLHASVKEPSASSDVVKHPTGKQIFDALRTKQQYHFVPMSKSMQSWTLARLNAVTDSLLGDTKKSEWHSLVASVHPHADDRFKDSLTVHQAAASDGAAVQLKRLLRVTHRHWHSDGSGFFTSRVQKMENASTISVQGFMRFLVALHVPDLESTVAAETFFKITNPCEDYESATPTRKQMDDAAAVLSTTTDFKTKFTDFCELFGPLSDTNLLSFASTPYIKLEGPLSASHLATFIEKAAPHNKKEVNAVTELCLDLSLCKDDVSGKDIDLLLNSYPRHLRVLTIIGTAKGVLSIGSTSGIELHALRKLQLSSLPHLGSIRISAPNLREIHLQHLPELITFSIGAAAEKMKSISSLKLENVDPCVLLDANLSTRECDVAVPATATPLLGRILHIDSYFWYASGHMIPNVITRNLPHVPWLSEEDELRPLAGGVVPMVFGRLHPITQLRRYEGPFGDLSSYALAEGILNGIQHRTAQNADVHTNIHMLPVDAGQGKIVNARPLTSLNPLWFGSAGIEAEAMSLMLPYSNCHITQFPCEHSLPAETLRHLKLEGPHSGVSGSLASLEWPELRMLQLSNVNFVGDAFIAPQLQVFEAISSSVPSSVLNCAQLTRVVLHNCKPIQSFLLQGLLRSAPGLSYLDLSGCLEPQCSDEMLPEVAKLNTMASIVWNKNPVSDATLEQLALCLAARTDPLQLLSLSHCTLKRLSEVALDCILSRSRKLNLTGNHGILVVPSAERFSAGAPGEHSVDLSRTNEQLVHAVISRCQNTSGIALAEICIKHVKLSAKSVLTLWRISQKAIRLDLSETHMTVEGLPPTADEPAGQAYRYDRLQTLAFSHNNIREIGIPRLIGILHAAPSIQTLDLSSNSLGDAGIIRLAEVLTASSDCAHDLRHLHLAFNILTDRCSAALVSVIRNHPKLLTLDINHNDFGEPALRSICTALHVTKIETLDISYNVYCAFTSALVQAVVRNVHLKHLRMSDIGTSRTHAVSTPGFPVVAPVASAASSQAAPEVLPTFAFLLSRLMLLAVLESADISRLPDIVVKPSEVPTAFALDFVESERRCIIRSALPRIAMHDSAACGALFKAQLPLCTLIIADESVAPLSCLAGCVPGLVPAEVQHSAFAAIAASSQDAFFVVARSVFPLFVFPDVSQPLTLEFAARFDAKCPVPQAYRYFKPDGMNVQRAWKGMVAQMRAAEITGCNLQVLLHSRVVDDSSSNRVHTRRLMIPVPEITDTLPVELEGLAV